MGIRKVAGGHEIAARGGSGRTYVEAGPGAPTWSTSPVIEQWGGEIVTCMLRDEAIVEPGEVE